MTFDYCKYHALGNDYIVIDPNKTSLQLNPETIRLICHRHFGVGSDGILFGPLFEDSGVIRLRIFNPDGGEAEKSGNGVRIFSRYLVDVGYVKTPEFSLQTLGGQVHVEILDGKGGLIKVDMGKATFQSQEIPVAGSPRLVVGEDLEVDGRVFRATCVSVGNPHCVIPVEQVTPELATVYGPSIEKHPFFPNRINVQFMEVLDRNNIRIEIWERGAGYTMASGSSSCAAASAARQLRLVDDEVTVHMPGGTILIAMTPDDHVHMTGSVNAVARGVLAEELKEQLVMGDR